MGVLLEVSRTYQSVLAVASIAALAAGCGPKGLDKPLPQAP
jgi:hypothetical protein